MAYKRSNFPETYDVFVEKLDLPASKLPLIEEYHTLYTKEVKTEAENARLNILMKDLESHIYTPEHINHFQDAMTNVQKFFVEGTSVYVQTLQDETTAHMDAVKLDATTHANSKKVEMDTYTDQKQQEIDLEVLKLQHKGTYSPTTTYFSKNIVDFTVGSVTQLYMCTKDNTVGKAPTTASNWLKLTIQGARGEKGTDGVGLLFSGKYDPLKTYIKDDGVQYGGILFASLKANNKGHTPNLSIDTEWWAKAVDVTVTVTQKSSAVVIDYDTGNVPFLNSDITAFNKDTDILEVYQNSTRLTQGVDYVINADNSSIDKVDDIWLGNSEPVFFEFVVTLNMINNLVFSSGTSIADGTINKSKLTADVQDELNSIDGKIATMDDKIADVVDNKMPILTEKVKPETPLNTTSQDLSGAVNELKGKNDENNTKIESVEILVGEVASKAGKIGTKDVDETDIADNYTLRYDGIEDKIVYVKSEIDREPPGKVTEIDIATGDTVASIKYTPPLDVDYMGTRLVYNTTGTPTSITDGTFIANYISETEITGLTNDTLHYFRLFPYDISTNYNVEEGQSIEGTPKAYQLYGVKIDVNNSNPATAVTYIDMAVGSTPMFCNNGSWQMGSWADRFPFNEIKPCVLKNGVVNYYLNPNDYTKKSTGEVSDITSGTDGDVMIEFPKIYWKSERIGTDLYVRYSDVQVNETYKCLAHTRGVTEKDKVYISAYMGNEISGKLRSLSGKSPTVSKTIGAFRTVAQANGSGYDQMAYYQLLMLQVLALVAGKNRDTQTQLGRGYVNGNSGAINTGNTNTKGMYYGENTGKQQNKFCGIEDFYGNIFYWIDGFFNDTSRNILIANQNFNDAGAGYENFGQGSTADSGGYIGDIQGGTETGFVIKTITGSETTHYADYGDLLAGHLAYFGGYWDDGAQAGAFSLRVHNSAANANSAVASRLLLL